MTPKTSTVNKMMQLKVKIDFLMNDLRFNSLSKLQLPNVACNKQKQPKNVTETQ